jgi:predicted transcriptional regulator
MMVSYNVLYRDMDKQTVSFRLDSDKVSALDTLAEALDRDRSYLLNEAVAAYLKVQEWQIEQIKEGLRQADHGKLIGHGRVTKMAAGWRRHR